MIKPALLLGAAMAGIAAGTYYGLELLPPGLIPPPIGRVAPVAQVAQAAPAPAPIVVAAAPAPAAPASDAAEAAPEPAAAEPVAETAAPAPAPAQAEPPKAIEARAADPAPEPAPAPVPAETAKAETATAAPAESTAPAARAVQEADAIKPWWPDPSTLPATQLKLQYAGQVKGQNAIALLFSSPLKLDTLQQHATVRAANGEAVAANWALGKNPKLAVLSGLAAGRYTVILQPPVADEQGYMLGTTLTGPVYVKEP